MKRKVCVVTGSRAEYGILRSLIRNIADSPILDLQIVATGTHVIPEYGFTINDITQDGLHVDAAVPIIISGNSKKSMTTSIGLGIIELSQVFSQLDPDIVVVNGDRFEILSAAIAAVYSGRVLAHLSGGDTLSAGYDEYTRHAVTKLSHLHFPFTEQNAKRLIMMGEDKKYVFLTGNPAIDTIVNIPLAENSEIRRKYGLPQVGDYCLLVQHPLSTNPENASTEMEATLSAVDAIGLPTIVIYPNADPGSFRIIELIEEFITRHKEAVPCKSIPFEDYLALMKHSSVMIGNSSSAIAEAPSFGIPAVNIGTRQEGREQGGNIINAPADTDLILAAIKKALYDKAFREMVAGIKNPYGDGNSGKMICSVFETVVIDKHLLQKKICY